MKSRVFLVSLSTLILLRASLAEAAPAPGCGATVAVDRWKGEYYPNTSLSGEPSLVRDDGTGFLNLQWGSAGPNACGIGVDNFSVRWTRTMFFNAGNYRFTATTDDGFRLLVDGQLKVDRFAEQGAFPYGVDVPLGAGNHTLGMEYFEKGGSASAQLSWTYLGPITPPLDAEVLEAQSSVPASLGPGETRQVVVRVKNTGTSTWTAADNVRLGAGPDNSASWSGLSCGGYATSASDARSYLCSSVAPGAIADFTFSITAPQSGTGLLSVRMVKELVAWFGESQKWTIPVASNPCLGDAPTDHWKGEYFANASLSGSPSLVRDDGAGDIAFDWSGGGPNACAIGVDNFSVRWTKTVTFGAGTYRFTTRTDDGVRVSVDNQLVIDKWIQQAPTVYTADVTLPAGSHLVKMEYFEQAGGAVAQLSWSLVGGVSACSQSVVADHWKGEYYPNTTLSGAVAMTRDDGAGDLGFDWGTGGPSACGIGVDNYSVRWTKTVTLGAGTYKFTVRVDDGVRTWVDGNLILDKWVVEAPTVYETSVSLGAGAHVVKVEYFEQGGGALAQVSWQQTGGGSACSQSVPSDRWKGEYWSNRDLSGAPVMVRDDGNAFLGFDWGVGSPSATCGVPVDAFSARFTRTVAFENETYRFTVAGDDGVRLYVDGQIQVDQWKDQAPTSYSVNVPLNAGNHTLRLDYYDSGGGALASLNWGRVAPPGEVRFGFHVLSYTDEARQEAARGARFFLIMDDFQGAKQLKDAYPDAVVMVRKYWGTAVPSVEGLLAGLEGAHVPGLVYTGLNENDGIGNTGDALRARARLDVEVARRIRDTSGATYAAGTFSMGTPDFTNPEVVEIIREIYAPAYNSGLIAFDMHLYSPTMTHIFDDAELKWYERRWEFLFTHCGFDPRIAAIYSSETGVDEGGVGGFKAHHATPEQVAAWVQRFKEVQRRPLVVNGVSYPSPFRGGAIFQLSGNQNPRWAGYEMADYLEVLRPEY